MIWFVLQGLLVVAGIAAIAHIIRQEKQEAGNATEKEKSDQAAE